MRGATWLLAQGQTHVNQGADVPLEPHTEFTVGSPDRARSHTSALPFTQSSGYRPHGQPASAGTMTGLPHRIRAPVTAQHGSGRHSDDEGPAGPWNPGQRGLVRLRGRPSVGTVADQRLATVSQSVSRQSVELRGIEPRSSSVDPGLLRVQSVMSLFSAPALALTPRRQAQSGKSPAHPS